MPHARVVVDDISPDFSFLEMIDILNEQLEEKGERPMDKQEQIRAGIQNKTDQDADFQFSASNPPPELRTNAISF